MKKGGKMNNFKAAIFDLDGTLFDSMTLWADIDRDFFSKRGIEIPEDYMVSIAHLGMYDTAVYTKNRFELAESPEELIAEWSEMALRFYSEEVTLKKGAAEYLRQLKEKGIPLAVATANGRHLFEPALKHTGIDGLFDAVVSSDEVERKKGFPDIYLLACKKLGGISAAETVVFEDILLGIKGAKDGGFQTVAVYDETSAENEKELRTLADRYIYDFTEMMK